MFSAPAATEDNMSDDAAHPPAEVNNGPPDDAEAGGSPPPGRQEAGNSDDSERGAQSLSRNGDTNVACVAPNVPRVSTPDPTGGVDWRTFPVDDIQMLLLLDNDHASDLVGRPLGQIRASLRDFYGHQTPHNFINETSQVFNKCEDIGWLVEMRDHHDRRPTAQTSIPRPHQEDNRKPAARKSPPELQAQSDTEPPLSLGMVQNLIQESMRNYVPQGTRTQHGYNDRQDDADSPNPHTDSPYALDPLGFVQVGLNATTITPVTAGVNHWTHALTENISDLRIHSNWGVHYWDKDRINVTHGAASASALGRELEYLTKNSATGREVSSLSPKNHITGFVPYTHSDTPTGMINPGRFTSQVLVGVKYPPSALVTQTNRCLGFSSCTSHSPCGRSILREGLRVMIFGENTFSINSKNTIYVLSVFEQKPGGFPGCRVGFVKCARNVIHVYHGRSGFIQYIAHNDHENLDESLNKLFAKVKGYAHIIFDDMKTMAQLSHPNNLDAWENLIKQTMVIPHRSAGLPTEGRVQANFQLAARTTSAGAKKRPREG